MFNISEQSEITTRKLFLSGEINQETIIPLIEKIEEINRIEENRETILVDLLSSFVDENCLEDIIMKPIEPIILEINTVGGELSYGFQLISAIQSSKVPIVGHVTGYCMSMGIPILSSCDLRTATEYARFMIHDIAMGTIGKYNDIEASAQAMKEERDVYVEFLVKNTNLNKEQVYSFINKPSDVNFGVDVAQEYGIIDDVMRIMAVEEYNELVEKQKEKEEKLEKEDDLIQEDEKTIIEKPSITPTTDDSRDEILDKLEELIKENNYLKSQLIHYRYKELEKIETTKQVITPNEGHIWSEKSK